MAIWNTEDPIEPLELGLSLGEFAITNAITNDYAKIKEGTTPDYDYEAIDDGSQEVSSTD